MPVVVVAIGSEVGIPPGIFRTDEFLRFFPVSVIGRTRAFEAEWFGWGVRVNALAPGWIETDFDRGILAADPVRRSKISGRTAMGRFGKPEDGGWAAVCLRSSTP